MERLIRRTLFFRGRRLALVLVWTVLAAYVVFPAVRTLAVSFFSGGHLSLIPYRAFFSVRATPEGAGFLSTWDWLAGSRLLSPGLQALYGSLSVSLISVLLAGLVGILLAFFVERNDFPGRGYLSGLLLLPLTLPPIVGVVSFQLIFSESGIIPRGLASLFGLAAPPFFLAGKGGVIAVHAYSFFPFFFLLVSNAVREMDGSLVEASRVLGMGRWRTFLSVEVPLLAPALFGASVMVFMLSMASFSAPLLFDVSGMYLSTHIYNLKTEDLWADAYTATALFTVASLLMLLILRSLRGKTRIQSVGKGAPRRRESIKSRSGRFLAGGTAGFLLILVLLPHLGILLWSFTKDGTWTYQILPPSYTLENYHQLFGSAEIARPILNSLWMAGLATLANVVFGIAAAYVLKGRAVGAKAATDLLVMLPWALPGTVIAVNLIVTFSHRTPLALGANLANTVWLLPIAYFIRNIPLVVRPVAAAWERYGDELEEAARTLGSGRLRTLRTVCLPVILPSLAAGGLLAFVTALGEFIASSVLFIPANKPISMALFAEFHSGAYALCSAYGVLLMVLIAAVMAFGGKAARGAAY